MPLPHLPGRAGRRRMEATERSRTSLTHPLDEYPDLPSARKPLQAGSLATPNSSIHGIPSAMTSETSVRTAPSMQPPDTVPRKFVCSLFTR